ncbi:hypothetical protein HOU03_gp423 [Caulobacter phage CcrSC]|uniref:Uncharacterized protein n=1 Tax=Caulobacter phage CcrSC TaxID=2283272 RepID=A0A385EFN9_9CAUD|nr:hypothetical protein HOU03_gp423 [Caulobacter phage CcrSC]AXQ69845.1 hypothetical protein CcrSC_gp263c [Caulobacter phage CcrSC]
MVSRRVNEAHESIPDASKVYGEPCNNCKLWDDGFYCLKRHRQKTITINTGHMPDITVRKAGGCPDHEIMAGVWWHEDPIKPHQSGYGGSSTNLLI